MVAYPALPSVASLAITPAITAFSVPPPGCAVGHHAAVVQNRRAAAAAAGEGVAPAYQGGNAAPYANRPYQQ